MMRTASNDGDVNGKSEDGAEGNGSEKGMFNVTRSLADVRRNRGSELDRWRNSLVSVFVGNIHPFSKDSVLLAEIKKYGRVLDFFFPPTRSNTTASRYGFVQFKDLVEASNVINEMNGMFWCRRNLQVKIAKPRSPHRPSPNPRCPITPPHPTLPTPPPPNFIHNPNQAKPSFAKVVSRNLQQENIPAVTSPSPIQNPVQTILEKRPDISCPNPPLVLHKDDLESEWLSHCAIAEVVRPDLILTLKDQLLSEGLNQFTISFLGGRKVLLVFQSRDTMLKILEDQKSQLDVFFEWCKPWSIEDQSHDHFIWLRVEKIPLHAWCTKLFKDIGNYWGTFITTDDNTLSKANLEKARILALVNKDVSIPSSQMIKVDGRVYEIKLKIEESLDFLSEESTFSTDFSSDCRPSPSSSSVTDSSIDGHRYASVIVPCRPLEPCITPNFNDYQPPFPLISPRAPTLLEKELAVNINQVSETVSQSREESQVMADIFERGFVFNRVMEPSSVSNPFFQFDFNLPSAQLADSEPNHLKPIMTSISDPCPC